MLRFCSFRSQLISFRKQSLSTLNLKMEDSFDPAKYMKIVEGSATMIYDKNEEVFYNKVQVFNRDLSIQVIRLFSNIYNEEKELKYKSKVDRHRDNASHTPTAPQLGINILDALAATGLRSIRYLKEIKNVNHVTINDLLPAATAQALENCRLNKVDESKVIISNADATMLMYSHRDEGSRYDVIDLDPYGSPIPFIDGAVQAINSGGLLCITATDTTALCGNYPEVCYSRYGSMPVRANYLHEMSLRILLHSIDAAANKYQRHIVPWLSITVDFYVRVFVRVFDSPAEVKLSCLRRGMVHQSLQCPSFFVQPLGKCSIGKKAQKKAGKVESEPIPGTSDQPNNSGHAFNANVITAPSECPETGGKLKIGGPIWIDCIHNQDIVDKLLVQVTDTKNENENFPPSTITRITGILTSISEELKDVPLHYNLADLASSVKVLTPVYNDFRASLVRAGYRVSQFHREPQAIKTDAPDNVVWDLIRSYAKINPPEGSKNKKFPENAKRILENTSKSDITFAAADGSQLNKKRVARFFPNPEDNWGPKRRAGRNKSQSDIDEAETKVLNEDEK